MKKLMCVSFIVFVIFCLLPNVDGAQTPGKKSSQGSVQYSPTGTSTLLKESSSVKPAKKDIRESLITFIEMVADYPGELTAAVADQNETVMMWDIENPEEELGISGCYGTCKLRVVDQDGDSVADVVRYTDYNTFHVVDRSLSEFDNFHQQLFQWRFDVGKNKLEAWRQELVNALDSSAVAVSGQCSDSSIVYRYLGQNGSMRASLATTNDCGLKFIAIARDVQTPKKRVNIFSGSSLINGINFIFPSN